MKILKTLVLTLLAVCLFAGCSSAKLKGEGPVMATGTPEIIDYPGIALGKTIPDWVMAIDEGANKKVAKALNLDKNSKIFVVTNKGNDLDFLKTWSDQVDVRAEVASSIEQTIAQSVQSAFEGTDSDIQEKSRAFQIYSASMTNLTINGLEKEASYWVKTRILKEGLKKAKKESDYIIDYTYYVVFSIDNDLFNKQVLSAIADVEDHSNQSEMLKEILSVKLGDQVILQSDETFDFVDYDGYEK